MCATILDTSSLWLKKKANLSQPNRAMNISSGISIVTAIATDRAAGRTTPIKISIITYVDQQAKKRHHAL